MTICGSLIGGLFSEPFFNVFAVSEETQNAIDEAEDEKEQLEQELEQQEQNKGALEGEKATAEERLENLKAQYKSISADLAALDKKKTEKDVFIVTENIPDAMFVKPQFSSDNAIGVAVNAYRKVTNG